MAKWNGFRMLMIAACLVWVALMIIMYLYWKRMPTYVSVALGFVIAVVGSDFRMFKIAFGFDDGSDRSVRTNSKDKNLGDPPL